MSDSQTQNGTGRCETSEVFDSVFSFLMDSADKAETIVPQPKRRGAVDDETANEVHDEEEKPLEKGDDGNVGELFRKLPVSDEEELLKDVFGEIVGNLLAKLPDDGKEAFLVRCFHGLFPKLSGESRREVEIKLKDLDLSSQSQEAFAVPSAPQFLMAMSVDDGKLICSDKRVRVIYPRTIGNPQPEPDPRPQSPPPQPLPGPTTA